MDYTFASLVDMLRFWADQEPDREALIFLEEGEDAHPLTFRELDERARGLGAYLQALEASGQRALLLYPSGIDFVTAVFGCVYAGVVGVLVVPPRPDGPFDYLEAAAENAGATIALTTGSIRGGLRAQVEKLPCLQGLRWVETDNLPSRDSTPRWTPPAVAETDLTFLIYSSGSTGEPKGVKVSHRSLIQAAPSLLKRLGLGPDSVFVCWIPLHHIAGLELLLRSLLAGGKVVLMPTQAFLAKPVRWLDAVTQYRGTFTFAFKFGLQSAIDAISEEERTRLDLSTLRILMITGERIQASALAKFSETFAAQGFRREAFAPGYGLTEVAGVATAPPLFNGFNVYTLDPGSLERNQAVLLQRGDPGGMDFVGCGFGFDVRPVIIVDPNTREKLEPGRIGEIWISAEGIAEGYWNRPEQEKGVFRATLATGEGPFLRTGDLGTFFGNDLVITGRIKDLILLRGKNYYSQDFEQAIQGSHAALVADGGAAFSIILDDEEKLAILHEVGEETSPADAEEVVGVIRKVIASEFRQPVHTIGLVRPGGLPRTPSGKIQRFRCRSILMGGDLDAIKISRRGADDSRRSEDSVAPVEPRTEAERILAKIWQEVFKIDRVSVVDNFFSLGGDSVIAIQVVAKANRSGFKLDPNQPLQLQTIAALAEAGWLPSSSGSRVDPSEEPEDGIPPGGSSGSPGSAGGDLDWSETELEAIKQAIRESDAAG